MPTESRFYSYQELFAETWQKYISLLPKYFFTLWPYLVFQIVYTFLIWKFPIAKGYRNNFRWIGEVILSIFVGYFSAIIYAITFRDRNKKTSFFKIYQEAWKLYGGFSAEALLLSLITVGGYFLFVIPGLIFQVWFNFFAWMRVYNPDEKMTHFKESRNLVKGYEWKIFWSAVFPIFLYSLVIIFMSVSLVRYPTFRTSISGLGERLAITFFAFFFGSFFVTMRGLIFERLQKIHPINSVKSATSVSTIDLPSWNLWQFYKDAWKLVWQNKKLLILGFAVVIFASASSSRFDFSKFQKRSSAPAVTAPASTAKNTSPMNTVKTENNPATNFVKEVLNQIPIGIWPLLFLEILCLFAFAFIYRLIVLGWAKAAMIIGVANASEKKAVDLTQIARNALIRTKSMIWLETFPLLVVISGMIGGSLLIFAFGLVSPFIGVLLAVPFVFVVAYILIRTIISLNFAERYCALQKISGSNSYEKGEFAATDNLWKSSWLGITNFILGLIIQLSLIWGLVKFGQFIFTNFLKNLHFPLISFALLPFLFILLFLTLGFSIFWKAFTYVTWHFAYRFVDDQKKKAKI